MFVALPTSVFTYIIQQHLTSKPTLTLIRPVALTQDDQLQDFVFILVIHLSPDHQNSNLQSQDQVQKQNIVVWQMQLQSVSGYNSCFLSSAFTTTKLL
jgi:hypothetical protein